MVNTEFKEMILDNWSVGDQLSNNEEIKLIGNKYVTVINYLKNTTKKIDFESFLERFEA